MVVPWLDDFARPRHTTHLPVVLTHDEATRLISALEGITKLMASVLYGSGLRVLECARLRVKDLDFSARQIFVRRGKGKKDRLTLFPNVLREPLRRHLSIVQRQHEFDLEHGGGFVELPGALSTKYPNAAREWMWHGAGAQEHSAAISPNAPTAIASICSCIPAAIARVRSADMTRPAGGSHVNASYSCR